MANPVYTTAVRTYMMAHGTGDQLDANDLGDWIKSWWQAGFDSSPVLYAVLIEAQVPIDTIRTAYARAGLPNPVGSLFMNYTQTTGFKVWSALGAVSSAIGVYHGYKRHQKGAHPIAWALWWGFMGGLFPVIIPVLAVAQGVSTPLAGAALGRPRRKRLR